MLQDVFHNSFKEFSYLTKSVICCGMLNRHVKNQAFWSPEKGLETRIGNRIWNRKLEHQKPESWNT